MNPSDIFCLVGIILFVIGLSWLVWKTFKKKNTQISNSEDKGQSISSLWYLLPLIFGIIGGVIAWLINRNRNSKEARIMLVGGFIVTVLVVLWKIFLKFYN